MPFASDVSLPARCASLRFVRPRRTLPFSLVRACRVEGVAAVEYGVALLEDLLPHLINPRPW